MVVALSAALLCITGVVLAAQLEVFTSVVTLETGYTTNPGKALSPPETLTEAPISTSASFSGGSVSPTTTAVTPIQNSVARFESAISPGIAAAGGGSTAPAPSVSTVAPLLNTVTVLSQYLSPQANAAVLSSAPVTPTQAIASPFTHAVKPQASTVAITPTRTLIASSLRARGMAITSSAVSETRALLIACVQGRAKSSYTQPIVEARTFHSEADSSLPVVQRTVLPIVSSVARRVSYGGETSQPQRGGTMEVSESATNASGLSGAQMNRTFVPLVNLAARWTNTMQLLSESAVVAQAAALNRVYPVAARTEVIDRITSAPITPASVAVNPGSLSLSSKVQGVSLNPASAQVLPASSTLAGVILPGVPAPGTESLTGATQTLTGNTLPGSETQIAGIRGETWEVKGIILGEVTIALDGTSSVVSNAQGVYTIAVTATGQHIVVASKIGFRSETLTVDVADLGTTYTLNFKADSGLVPNAPNLSYTLACVNRWLFPPEGLGLSMTKVLSVINAWNFPVP